MAVRLVLKKTVMGTGAKLKSLVAHPRSAIFARIKEALFDAAVGCFNKRQEFLKKVLPKNAWGDRVFAKLLFFASHRRLPTDSMTFNDVLYRIKTTFDIIDPLRVFVTDKEFVKIYVAAVVGNDHNVPTLGIIRNRADVQNYDFPPVCCIKPTHLSGHYILRKHGEPIDRGKIERWWDESHYINLREANYRSLRPKGIVERLLDADSFIEYYCFCYMAVPKLIFVSVDHTIGKKRALFDAQWNELGFSLGFPKASQKIPKPRNLEKMLLVAQKLSSPFSFIRIDFYSNGSMCYVGEITNCHASAVQAFVPVEAEQEASKLVFGKTQEAQFTPENIRAPSVVGTV
jgi:hypothetical protein